MMRIITGTARGTRLETLEGENTRPTAERVKEAIFSMIQFDIEGRRIFDIFSGSGQLALEALSRGAANAVLGDSSRDACEIIKKNAQKTHLYDRCRVLAMDYKDLIRAFAGKEKFDIVFIDPPYEAKLIPDTLDRIVKADILNENALVICESDFEEEIEAEGLTMIKHNRYGRIWITVFIKTADNDG